MPDNNIKIAADITFNTKDAERQLSNLGNTVSKSVSTSKQVREMADSFNRMSTRDMNKPMARVVTSIREAVKESSKWEGYLNSTYREYENLQASARKGIKMPDMSAEYRKLISDQEEYQAEIKKTQELLARGTKTVAGSTEGLKYGESAPAITRALTPDEIAQAEQYLTSLQGKLQGVQTEMGNMEQRGDAFPTLTKSIETATIALNRTSEKIVGLISNFNNLSASAPQAASATEASLNGVYDAMSKMSGINMAQPVQANAASIEQSMQDVTQATTENVQQVQQQVEGIKQTVAQPVQAQIIDTSALQNQVAFLSGILTNLTSNVNTQMNALTQSVTSGFQGIAQQSASNMQSATGQITSQIAQLESAVHRAESATGRVGTSAKKSSRVAVISFASITKAIQQVFSGAQKLGSAIGDRLRGSFSKLQKSVDKAFSQRTFKRGLTTILKYGFGVRSLYFAFRKLRAAVKEGLENLVKYEKAIGTSKELTSTNYAITQLRTSLLYLKNAWAAAFAPIINAVMPYLRMLIDGIASAGNAVARFIAVLTGQQNVIQAVKVSASDYADSLDDAAKSAGGASSAQKKLNDRLAAFDDLNVLGKDSDTGGGGGGGSALDAYEPNPEDMFTIIDSYSDFADKLKDAFEQSGFFGIGRVISDSVSNWLENIDWNGVKQKANEVGTAIGDLFRGLFGNPDFWSNLGDAGAGIANALIYGLKGFLDSNRNVHYGQMIAEGLNNFFRNTDWKQAGLNIYNLATGILDNIIEFFKTANSPEFEQALHDFFGELNIGDIVWKAGEVIVEGAKVILKVAEVAIEETGNDFGEWLDKITTEEFDVALGDMLNKKYGSATGNEALLEEFKKTMNWADLAKGDVVGWLTGLFKQRPKISTDISAFADLDFSFASTDTQQKIQAITDSIKEQKIALDSTRTAWNELNDAQINSIYSGFAKIEDVSGLYAELKSLVDASGKVMDGYEYRAEFIIGKLNEALGIEIRMNNGVIEGLDGIGTAIDRVIAKKKAQIILNAQEETYANAIMNIYDATKKLEAADAEYNKLLQEKIDLETAHTDALALLEEKNIKLKENGYVPSAEEFQAWLDAENLVANYDDRLAELDQDIIESGNIRKGYQQTVDEYTTAIQTYEANMVLAQKGIYDSMVINIKDGTDRATMAWHEGLDAEISELTGRQVEFKNLGNGMVQMFVDEVAYGIPRTREEMAEWANSIVDEISDVPDKAKGTGTQFVWEFNEGVNDKPANEALATSATRVGGDAIDALDKSLNTGSPSKEAEKRGKWFVEGVGEGVGNQNTQSSVFNKIKTFGENLLSKLSGALKEHSPSKATEQMGVFLLEGLTNGIEDEAPNTLNTIAEFGNSVVDAFGGVADDVQSPMENMIEFVGGFIDILVEGISTLISKIGELATIQPTLSGFSRPSLPTIPMPSIAEGTVIPANSEFIKSIESQTLTGDEQYAMVKQAIAEVMSNNGNAEVVRLLQQLIGVVESKELVIGDKDIGKANARYNAQQKLIRGTSF